MQELQGTFKLRVKIDGQEFEAEGLPDLVSRQFEAFRLMIQEGRSGQLGRSPRVKSEGPLQPDATHALPADQNRHDSALTAIFRISPRTQFLSLHHPPAGTSPEADAVLLLLFGHKRLRDEEDVPVTVLTEALKQSGCPVKRLDRILAMYTKDRSVLRSGRGKGGKYRLSNLGLKKAETLAQAFGASA